MHSLLGINVRLTELRISCDYIEDELDLAQIKREASVLSAEGLVQKTGNFAALDASKAILRKSFIGAKTSLEVQKLIDSVLDLIK